MLSSPATSHIIGDRDFYSVAQVASRLNVSRESVWRWIRSGQLHARRVGPRTTRIAHQELERFTLEQRSVNPWSWISPAGSIDWSAVGAAEHFVQFYDADDSLLDAVSGFIVTALRAGDAGVIVATATHRHGIEQRLLAAGVDLAAAQDCDQYMALDADETLSTFMVNERPDPERFISVIERIIERASHGSRRVRVFGEMVALLAAQGNHSATVQLEELWNNLQTRQSFALFCAYPTTCLGEPGQSPTVSDVCGQHGRVIPAESYTSLPNPDDRHRAIIEWQHKALALEAALAAELNARKSAENALKVRDEFLSLAAHELKTPLTTLSGYAQMACRQLQRDGQLEPERAVRTFDTIKHQSEKLSRLVTQLLDVSRLETGNLPLARARTDLTLLVEQVAYIARMLSDRHLITVLAPASFEAWVDPLRLEQVLMNLLTNAIKYTPEGGQVDIVLCRGADDSVEFTVRDYGPGIPVENQKRLFERFYQAHLHNHQGGLGLGLYVSRQFIELHGGSIHAEFPSDGGTRFVVRLPIGS